ncbi:MAG: PDZ domain-containing protein [Candidatus Marinimicrobia bacterium]|nr:PDZ domain-containing protein [Candidatus Neomarinimicrobiota bacterium]MCF7829953.1 PDZ domain-containing protein [Candidatus Neomarinimicrobiota bacterium]MCF7881893.1 PDZ domain-containing protein [Candidatus Neomarinimicrobiota bacterium]
MSQSGYYRYPVIRDELVIFVSEDDLWQVPLQGGTANRVTSNPGEVTNSAIAPGGKYIAFTGSEEGHTEVYIMPGNGGESRRLTYLGSNSKVVGFSRDGKSVLFSSNAHQPFGRFHALWKIDVEGGLPEQLPYGLAHDIAYGDEERVVIGRNTGEPARWKRYRGGTAGVLWIGNENGTDFRKLLDIDGNLASPLWINGRIYFISDHNGIGNLWSVNPDGKDLQQHTNHKEFFARNATTDGKFIVYHAGGNLYRLEPGTDAPDEIPVEYHSQRSGRNRKFVSPGKYLESYAPHPEGHSLAVTSRGKPFTFANWEGAVEQIGQANSVRYQMTRWLHDGDRLVTVADETGEEHLEIYAPDSGEKRVCLNDMDIGRPLNLHPSPTENKVAFSNHRHELVLVDLDAKEATVLDRSEYQRLRGVAWSPDGCWIAFSCAETQQTFSLKIANVKSGKCHQVTPPRFRDVQPSFDPDGKYLYFLSYREFNPVYDSMYFDLNFPRGMRPYLVTLREEIPSPFIPHPKPPGGSGSNSNSNGNNSQNDEDSDHDKSEVAIDFAGIENRIIKFPVPEGRYQQIQGVKGKALFSVLPVKGALDRNIMSGAPKADATLEYYDFSKQKKETVSKNVTSFRVAQNSGTLFYRSKNKIRALKIEPLKKQKSKSKPGRESGWIDLSRIKVSVDPPSEWEQMFNEIWRLQREHFWTEDMSGVDWQTVYDRYHPLLNKVTSRSEFSDLIWEMQGELGTSHAYEIGGDYPRKPTYKQGFLGADYEYDSDGEGYILKNFIRGDSWKDDSDSPLRLVGAGIEEGDLLLAVNGQRVSAERSPQELLVNHAGDEVKLTLRKPGNDEPYSATVKALKNETDARYRQWVERNLEYVRERTDGKVGYVHIPNMGPVGYAEFHRYYLAEVDKESLIVDVRFNGGGHVSQLILEKLARQRIGYDVQRWGKPEPYPSESVLGPIVALTNEHAGSDGDIFSHCFKLMNLGTLIGKRTWGGVIGIFPRHFLVDGSVTTQPEFSFWFEDVGWGVENYGTDPDIDVDITPEDYASGADPQLDRAIEEILKAREDNPTELPDFEDKPDLSLPK